MLRLKSKSVKAMNKGTMKNRGAFLVGCLAGCLLSSMFYVWWSGLLGSNAGGRFQPRLLGAPLDISILQPSNSFSSSDRPWTLASELRSKKRLLVVVLTSRDRLNKTVAMVNETWASWVEPTVDYSVFVAGEGPTMPGVYWLSSMKDFQPGRGNLKQVFHVLNYLHTSFVRHYHWFLLASEDTYIAVRDLEELLTRLDASKPVYMGRLASEDLDVMALLHLLPNEYYCEWGPGIILSNAALVAVADHLDSCASLAGAFGSDSLGRSRLEMGDVELGRCFSRRLGIQCTASHEAQSYFVHDRNGLSLSPEHLWYDQQFQNLLTLYPVRDVHHMRAVHHFTRVRDLEKLQQKLAVAENRTNKICKQVSPDFAAPLTEPAARSCHLRAFNHCNATTLNPFPDPKLPQNFKVSNHYELTPWMYINPVGLYHSTTTTPVFKVVGEFKEEINFLIKRAISTINLRELKEWVLWRLIGCHVRYSGTRGREYLLDMELAGKRGERVRRRFNILRPHTPDFVMLDDTTEEALETRVNVLVPLSHVGERFREFLHIYEQQVLKHNENVTLVLIVFGKEVSAVNETLQRYQARYPDADFVVVPSEGAFSRGSALDLGMSQLAGDDLAFLCDVDMTFDRTFLEHCRLNTVAGERLYYPEFFKYYDMKYVYRFKRKPAELPIKRSHGHWAGYSYGMLCVYKSDYDTSGGFDTSLTGWGGEDVHLFERMLATGLRILKAPDPSLSHRYHEKTCSLSLSPDQFAMCISSRNEGLADRMQLAEYVYYLEDQCGIRDRPLWT